MTRKYENAIRKTNVLYSHLSISFLTFKNRIWRPEFNPPLKGGMTVSSCNPNRGKTEQAGAGLASQPNHLVTSNLLGAPISV